MTSVSDLPIRSRSTLHPNAMHAFPAGGIRAIATPRAPGAGAGLPVAIEYAPHAHAYGQLLFTTRGVLVIDIDGRCWIVPPLRAIWIPPRTVHAIRALGDVRICALYVGATLGARLPAQLSAMAVSPLLRELASRVDAPLDCERAHDPVARLCIDELQQQAQLPLSLPMPRDRRLLKLCERLQREPYCDLPLDTLASDVALSTRHLARLFRQATGMSVAAWRQQLRLSMSLALLADGMPVTQVAHQVGYRSPTTYAATFKRAFGVAPSQYFATPEDAAR
ncbi:helix-turn-helix transcriptional regulator [Burkholderia plantarii]|nr:helix-turn-helix transcriptional regulator [Burkholderia plantarii]